MGRKKHGQHMHGVDEAQSADVGRYTKRGRKE